MRAKICSSTRELYGTWIAFPYEDCFSSYQGAGRWGLSGSGLDYKHIFAIEEDWETHEESLTEIHWTYGKTIRIWCIQCVLVLNKPTCQLTFADNKYELLIWSYQKKEKERLIQERRQLKKHWKWADDEQREGIGVLQAEVKCRLATLRKVELLRQRWKKKEQARIVFYKDPFKFVKSMWDIFYV